MPVKILGFDTVAKKITAFWRSDMVDKTTMSAVGDFIQERVYQFTKSGKSIAQGKKPVKLKELKPGYIKFRRKYKGPKGDLFSPARSNLTLTGQMLDALTRVVDTSKHRVSVFVKRTRRDGDNKSNAEVAKEVAAKGREFLGLDETGEKRVANMVAQSVREKIRQRFNR